MKIKKFLTGITIIIVLILIAGFAYLNHIKTKSLPDYNEDIRLEGISGKVEVFRDSFAIPHIYAENEIDLYTAVGYIMAQDRLWQMDLLRRATSGRLSEIFGKDLAEVDLLFRALRIKEKSELVLSKSNDNLKASLNAFCNGVNQLIKENAKQLPPEFSLLKYRPEKWLPEHSLNLIGYMAWDLAGGWDEEVFLHQLKDKIDEVLIDELIPDETIQKSYIHPDFQLANEKTKIQANLLRRTKILEDLGLTIFNASNNWAVSGKKSLTGKPILANDMHLGLSIPGIWYQMHQVIKGKLNVTGVSLPGQPMIVAGHNDKIAWGFTNVMVDNCDFYLETINPDNPDQYLFNGSFKNLIIRKEIIYTKEGDTLELFNKFTHRGPIVSEFKGVKDKIVSMRWTGNDYSNEFRTIYLLNRAGNWDEFKTAIETFTAVCQNVVYADIEGNIGLYSVIGLPIRKGDGISILPGETDEFDWKGKVPFEDLPHTYNPECGYVISANNRTTGPDYPYYISSWYDLPYRFDRIYEMINKKEKLSTDDFIKIQTDQKSKMAEAFNSLFIKAIDKTNFEDELETKVFDILKNWDHIMAADSRGASIFELLYYNVVKELTIDELGEELFNELSGKKILMKSLMENIRKNNHSAWTNNITSNKTENLKDIITSAFRKTVKNLSEKLGSDPEKWSWGNLHKITLYHPIGKVKLPAKLLNLNRGPFPVGGSYHTVCPYTYPYPIPDAVDWGASHRHIYSLSDWNNSLTVIPTGTSGIPASKYYCDQTELYVKNKYHKDYFSIDLIEKSSKYRMIITAK